MFRRIIPLQKLLRCTFCDIKKDYQAIEYVKTYKYTIITGLTSADQLSFALCFSVRKEKKTQVPI